MNGVRLKRRRLLAAYIANNRTSELLENRSSSPLGTNVCKGGFTKRLDFPNGFLRIFSEMTDPLTKIPSLATIKVLINSEPL